MIQSACKLDKPFTLLPQALHITSSCLVIFHLQIHCFINFCKNVFSQFYTLPIKRHEFCQHLSLAALFIVSVCSVNRCLVCINIDIYRAYVFYLISFRKNLKNFNYLIAEWQSLVADNTVIGCRYDSHWLQIWHISM